MPDVIEKGDLYFLYRNKVGTERAERLADVQRFYMVMVPDGRSGKSRMFTVGKKRMPEMDVEKSGAREWLMNVMTGPAEEIGDSLAPIEYETKTRGVRRISEAFPAGEARYALVHHEGHTELAYRLVKPEEPGPAQEEMEIRREASYVISVRNPDVQVEGFPEQEPGYPRSLKELFAEKRWIDVREPRLLEYEGAQLVMLAARDRLDELDLRIPGSPALFEALGLEEKEWPTETLYEGRFAATRETLEGRAPDEDPSKGGRRGGRRATRSASAAGVATALKGVDLPMKKDDLIDYAEDHDANEEVLETLKALPDRKFETMADVERALGEVR